MTTARESKRNLDEAKARERNGTETEKERGTEIRIGNSDIARETRTRTGSGKGTRNQLHRRTVIILRDPRECDLRIARRHHTPRIDDTGPPERRRGIGIGIA